MSDLKYYSKYISKGKKVLDVGSGNGLHAYILKRRLGVDITCLDLGDYRWTISRKLKHKVYGGKRIPFSDNSFNCTLLFLVLHHAENPTNLLLESIRVSKNKIIIMEETCHNTIQKQLMILYDILLNLAIFGQRITSPKFYEEKNLEEIIYKLKLSSIRKVELSSPWWRLPNRIIYILTK